MFDRRWRIAALMLLLVAFGVRLWGLDAQSLWEDETWTAAMATRPIMESYRLALADGVHPPLYYAITRLVVLLGQGEWILRWPSAMFGVLAVALIFRLAKAVWDSRAALWASALMSVQPFAVWYSQEARQYSLLIALSLGVMLAFVHLAQSRTRLRWLSFILVSALAYLTHYFALLLPFVQFIWLVISIRRNHTLMRNWVMAQAAAVVPVALWIMLFLQLPERNFGIGWLQRPDLAAIPRTLWRMIYYTPLSLPWTVGGWAVALALAWLFLRRQPAGWPAGRPLVGQWLVTPIIFVWLISQRRPFYHDRFFIICLPAALLTLAAGLDAIQSPPVRRGLGLCLLTLSLWTVFQFHTPEYSKEDWRQIGAWLRAEGRAGDVIVLPDQKMTFPLSYYYTDEIPIATTLDYWKGLPALQEWGKQYQRLWVIYYDRTQAWDLLNDRDSFSICEHRTPSRLVVFICPAAVEDAAR